MAGGAHFDLFIGGAWRRSCNGADLPLINPASEREFGRVACASPADLDEALTCAQNGLRIWAATSPQQRGALLTTAARLLKGKASVAAAALSAEQGKTLGEAEGEYARAIETLEWNGAHAEDLCAPIPMGDGRFILPEPIGVVAAFTPWNYPAVLNARKLAAPLAAGCPVILKGAEETPSAAVFIVEALQDAGLPPGVVNLVFGKPAEISEHLLASPTVRMLTFTGSTHVGKVLARLAAANLQRCVSELGGHSPVVVFQDADLDQAVAAICNYKFECAGQSCNAPSRILVERPIYDSFVERISETARRLKIGAPDDPSTQMGPMANGRRVEAMARLTADAIARGARVEVGGERLDRPGFYWPPTILTQVAADSAVLHEEPFGPILTVMPFDSVEDAITQANATDYGLASYVFSRSPAIQHTMARSLSAGAVSINTLKGVSADAPNGGINQSGYGYEGGVEGLRSFQNLKLVNNVSAFDPA